MPTFVTEPQITNLATQIASTIKANKVLINNNAADLSALTTTAKGNLVAALNEVRALAASGSATTLDALTDVIVSAPATGHILRHNGSNFINVLGTTHFEAAGAVAAHAAVVTGAHPATAISFVPANGIAAVNVQGAIEEAKTDAQAYADAAVAALVNSAPAALNTLSELSTALGGDANFAATTATALGNRVRFDAAQTLTGPQQIQARANIGAADAASIVTSTADFVATFNAGIA